MIRPDLPVVLLGDLPGGPEPVVLCATARLALDLRRAHGDAQVARGAGTWRALQSSTPALWLDALVSRALLRGEIPPDAVAGGFLGQIQERNLWELAIARDVGAAADLFDREGMALAAMEASSLQRTWRIEVPEALHTGEYLAWLRWRAKEKTKLAEPRTEQVLMQAQDHAGNITITAAIWGLIGAKLFHWLEYPSDFLAFISDPTGKASTSGLTMYGGLILAGEQGVPVVLQA